MVSFWKKKDRMFNKTLVSFQKILTWLVSSRMCTKSVIIAQETSKLSDFGHFWRIREISWKKTY